MGAAVAKHARRPAANELLNKAPKEILNKVEPVTCPSRVQQARQLQNSESKAQKEAQHVSEPNSMEMNKDILQQIERIDFTEKVEYLEQNDAAFRKTAIGQRISNLPADDVIEMPKDRTSASSSFNTTPENFPGRLTFVELREMLSLHHQNQATWTAEALAAKFGIEEEKIANIITHVGPPKLIPPSSSEAYPQGVWIH